MTVTAPALRLDLRPSRRLAGALGAAHGLALGAAWFSLTGWAWYVAAGAIIASLFACRVAARRRPLTLELYEDGRAAWGSREEGWSEGRLARSNFASAALVVVGLESGERGREWVVLMRDSTTSPDDFRRLRVWLRWWRATDNLKGDNLTKD